MERKSLDELNKYLEPINIGVNGEITIVGNPNPNVGLYLAGVLGGATAGLMYGIVNITKPSALSTAYYGFTQNPVDLSLTNNILSTYYGYTVAFPTSIGTTTAQYVRGFVCNDASVLMGSVQTVGYYSGITPGVNKYNFYSTGANNLFQGDTVITANLFQKATTVALATTTPVTMTIANILNPIVTVTPAAAQVLNLPTGALIEANFTNVAFLANTGIEWNLINTSGSFASTVTASTGHTVVGNMVVALGTSARFITRKTATDTYVTYRV